MTNDQITIDERIEWMSLGMKRAYKMLQVGNEFVSAYDLSQKEMELQGWARGGLDCQRRNAFSQGAYSFMGDVIGIEIDRNGYIKSIKM